MIPHPFLDARRRLRGGWWIAIFMLLLLALLAPLIIVHQASANGVPIWQQGAVLLIASLAAQALRRKPLAELFGAFNMAWIKQLALGCALGALLMAMPALLLTAAGLVEWRPSAIWLSALWPAFVLFAAVAVAEELMFRGFVFQRLLDGLGQWPPQLIVGGFFVLTHSAALQEAGPLGLIAGLNIFLASIMFGLTFIKTRSLAMPIGIHFAANFMQGGVLGFDVSGNEEIGALSPILAPGMDWLTGGAFGLEASLPGLVCVGLCVVGLLMWRRTPSGSLQT